MNAGPSSDLPQSNNPGNDLDPRHEAVDRLLGRAPMPQPDAWFAARNDGALPDEKAATVSPGACMALGGRQRLGSVPRGGVACRSGTARHAHAVGSGQSAENVQEAFEIMASIDNSDTDSAAPSTSWQDSSLYPARTGCGGRIDGRRQHGPARGNRHELPSRGQSACGDCAAGQAAAACCRFGQAGHKCHGCAASLNSEHAGPLRQHPDTRRPGAVSAQAAPAFPQRGRSPRAQAGGPRPGGKNSRSSPSSPTTTSANSSPPGPPTPR